MSDVAPTQEPAVTVIFPALDEAETIGGLVEQVRSLALATRILVVDDGSTDDTAACAAAAGAEVFRHARRRGNGAAIKTALAVVSTPYVVILDADGQHDPRAIPLLVKPLREGADLVVACRPDFRSSGRLRDLGNRLLSGFASYMARSPIPDLTSGFRALRLDRLRPFVSLLPDGFSTPTTSTLAFLHSGHDVRFEFVPQRRSASISRTRTRLLQDGARFLVIAARVTALFHPLRAFAPPALGLSIGGALWLGWTRVAGRSGDLRGLGLLAAGLALGALAIRIERSAASRRTRRGAP